MILTAILFIEGHATEQDGIPLNSCDYAFTQEVDQRGLPVAQSQIGIINFSFASFEDSEIVWWGMSNTAKNGKIVFTGMESTKAFKTLVFQDGHCIKYHEKFSRDIEMTIDITISARYLELSGVMHEDNWPGHTS
ncbi:MAG: type VI secretion system tube protein TssD [Bacteroidia bacterium]|nr:type VI secretion system tube protein TssD [Bacteroidia bacterium]